MLERVLLVGGAARMPLVARKVEQFFGRPPAMRINPEEVVALGAAIQAALLDRTRPNATGPMSHPHIAEVSVVALPPEQPAVPGNFPSLPLVGPHERAPAPTPSAQFLPGATSKPLVFDVPKRSGALGETPNDAAQSARNPPPLPERARAQTVVSARSPSLLIDVTPLNLGVETAGGFCDVLIEANTPVPCDKTRTFTTASDAQTVVRIRVAQGKSERFAENTLLGELELSGMAPAPRGETQIAVTFEIDADGILQVRARDVRTRQETAARMQLVGGSSDIEAMRARQAAHPLPPLGQ